MSKIIYVCHYGTKENPRNTSPAGITLMNYIIDSVNNAGYSLTIFSPSQSKDGINIDREVVKLKEKNTAIYMKSFKKYGRKNLAMRFIQNKRYNANLVKELDLLIENGDTVIAYHSLGLVKALAKIRKRKKFTFILQVAEIYADALNNLKLRKKEIEFIKFADKYIFISSLLQKELGLEDKKCVVCSGSYALEDTINTPPKDDKIHIVYAGTLDTKKGGAYFAVSSAKYLSDKYHVHILGFGREHQMNALHELIENTKKETECSITYDGCLQGKEYVRFLQGCHIGLSTQNPDGAYNATSFPSKILVYLANGLKVVSIKIPAIETSPVGQVMHFYEKSIPEEIAKAITSVNIEKINDSRELIKRLDKEFLENIKKLLEY